MTTGLNDPARCQWCGCFHAGIKCPLVKSIEYGEGSIIKKVEFFAPGDYQKVEPVTHG